MYACSSDCECGGGGVAIISRREKLVAIVTKNKIRDLGSPAYQAAAQSCPVISQCALIKVYPPTWHNSISINKKCKRLHNMIEQRHNWARLLKFTDYARAVGAATGLLEKKKNMCGFEKYEASSNWLRNYIRCHTLLYLYIRVFDECSISTLDYYYYSCTSYQVLTCILFILFIMEGEWC